MRRTTIALALLLALAGCGSTGEPSTDDPGTDASTQDPSTSQSPSQSPTAAPSGGTIDEPTVAEPSENLLDWKDTGHRPEQPVVRGREWQAAAAEDRSTVTLSDGSTDIAIRAGSGRTISEVLMSEDWAVVVRQDTAETRPSEVDVVDLATGERSSLAGPTPASGGSWALAGGDVYYPTYGDDRAYCLATSALADSNGEDGWCAPARTGFSGLTASDRGVGILTFDNAAPVSCRTANLLGNGTPEPIEGPTDCLAWDIAAAADGAVWSEVPKPRRQEEATFHASAYGAFYDLGPGLTGSLVTCGDSQFFVRDPQGSDDPARLMRWTPEHTLEVAYESPSVGNAFLTEPTCGGGVLAVSSFGEDGDEQVWADVT